MSLLRKESKIANNLTEAFRDDLEKYFYLSFFETLLMKGRMVSSYLHYCPWRRKLSKQIRAEYLQIVDKKLATLGMTGTRERELFINANHSQMCNLASPFHPDYLMVTRNLAELAERAVDAQNIIRSFGNISSDSQTSGENSQKPALFHTSFF